MTNKTQLLDQENKVDLIEHINQDHGKEVLAIIQAYSDISSPVSAIIADVFKEGVDIEVTLENERKETIFTAFQMQGEVEEQMLYLAYSAMAKLGISLSDMRRQFFEVTQSEMLTKNMLRLTIQSQVALPEASAGYAYGFMLKTLEKMPSKQKTTSTKKAKKNKIQILLDCAFLWVIKQLSAKKRKKIIYSMNKGLRYYTLQSTWKSSPNSNFADVGYIDIFLHGETEGSVWAKTLNKGDVIGTRFEAEDRHENLHTGQALLIADETAFPAVLGLIENWSNPVLPYLFIVSTEEDDQAYFEYTALEKVKQTIKIVCSPDKQSEHVIAEINKLKDIETVWGALEKDSAKNIRTHLRNEVKLTGKNNRVKGYWDLTKTER